MDQREPAAVESDRLGAAAKLLGRDRGRRLGDGPGVIVHDAGRIAQIDELQLVADDLRHPVLLVPPRPLRAQHAPIGRAGMAAGDDSSMRASTCSHQPSGVSSRTQAMHHSSSRQANSRASSKPRTSRKAGAGMSAGGRISARRSDGELGVQPEQEIARMDRRIVRRPIRAVVRQREIDGALHKHDLVAQSRHRRVRRMVAVGRGKPDRTRREGWHHRAGGLQVEEQVRAREIARLRPELRGSAPASCTPQSRGPCARDRANNSPRSNTLP